MKTNTPSASRPRIPKTSITIARLMSATALFAIAMGLCMPIWADHFEFGIHAAATFFGAAFGVALWGYRGMAFCALFVLFILSAG